jgi:hypothetical protein
MASRNCMPIRSKKHGSSPTPGCFSSAAILPMAPLFKTGIVDPLKVVVDDFDDKARDSKGEKTD